MERIEVDGFRALPDGRAGAVVTLVARDGTAATGFQLFAQLVDRWLIDDRVVFERDADATPAA